MTLVRNVLQETVILLFRPVILREIWGWGKIYNFFVGSYRRDWFWQDAKKQTIKGRLNDFLMELDISKWADRSTFFLGRWYDLPTQQIVKQVLNKGDVVIDVGANVGMFSLVARHIVGQEGFVHSFEPNPATRKCLNRNIEINDIDNIKVYPLGLGEVEGEFSLYVPHVNSGEGSLARFSDAEYEISKFYEIQIEVKVGDSVLREVAPRLIKIDVEGAEIGVLRGMSQLISRHLPLIICEYVPTHIHRFSCSFKDFRSIAQEHSYQIFKLGLSKIPGGYDLLLTPVEESELNESCDILLAHI